MKNVNDSYTTFHESHNAIHVYPTEWVIRTFLGNYPSLSLDKTRYAGAKILDLGFGDGRNWPLLHNQKFSIHGVEITEKIVSLGYQRVHQLGISANLKAGRNSAIPFEDNYFDYLLACHSCYYVDKGTTFQDNLKEFFRVLKPGATFIASLPEPNGDILKGGVEKEDGHVEIWNDPWGLRNGYLFKVFESEQDIQKTFSPFFDNFSIGLCCDNYYGVQINVWLLVCQKRLL
ncbi:MAG: class I SAM-dependent methyltransferase [Anaerolineales bacterium]|nr:class I SAM-dependent methyltransferase [Anaerolineales bacterium]